MRLKLLLACLVLMALYLMYGHNLAERDLTSSHEARAAMDAQSILDDGDWLLPHLYDGSPELQKPPFYYWLVALVGYCQGGTVDPLAVRLPATVAALGCLLLLIVYGVSISQTMTGVLAALLLATFIHFTSLARTGRIDMALTFTVAATVIAFTTAAKQMGWVRFWLQLGGCIAFAAGALLKGPIGLVLPLAILGANALTTRCVGSPWPRHSRRYLPWAVPLVCLLVIPWYFWVHIRTDGAFSQTFFWYHNVTRGLGGSDLRAHPWWFYGPFLIYGLLPWSLLIPLFAWHGYRHRLWREDGYHLGLVWLATVVLLLSLSRFKRADYLAPAYPAAALLMAWSIQMERQKLSRAWQEGVLAVVLLTTSVGWVVYTSLPSPSATARFAQDVRIWAPQPSEVILFRTENHLLSWHLGRPQRTLIEWNDLKKELGQPGSHWVLLPPGELDECRRMLPSLRGQVLLRNAPPDRPLVLLWSALPSTDLPCPNYPPFPESPTSP